MKAASPRHESGCSVATRGVEEPRGESTAVPGEAGGDAGNNPGVLAEGPWAGRVGGEGLRMSADKGGV